LDQDAALEAIPKLLPADANQRLKGFNAIQQVLSAREEISGEVASRLQRVYELFEFEGPRPALGKSPGSVAKIERAKAS
jgi:hypothetical protein